MFPNQFQFDENPKIALVIIKLIYPKIFHSISPSIGLNMIEKWACLFLMGG